MYSFRMSFWMVPESLAHIRLRCVGRRHVQGKQNRGGGVDGHRRGDAAQRDSIEEPLHVRKRTDGHAHAAGLARGQRMVGIHAHLRREVEGDGEPGHALRKQIAVAAVALLGGAEASVLAHGPEPRAVHLGMDAAGEGKLAGEAEIAVGRKCGQIVGGVKRLGLRFYRHENSLLYG